MDNDTRYTLAHFTIGDKVYYTGDAANVDGWFEVAEIEEPSRFCGSGSVDLIETQKSAGGSARRVFRGVYVSAFNPSPGRRFVRREEWLAQREAALAAYRR